MEYKKNLISIDHTKREATFQKLDSEDLETETLQVWMQLNPYKPNLVIAFLWDIGKQYIPRSDAAECGV